MTRGRLPLIILITVIVTLGLGYAWGASGRWTVETDLGDRASAPFCVMATGCLSAPKQIDIPGADSLAQVNLMFALEEEFGVVFSDRALEFLKADDDTLYQYLTPHLENWPDITIVHNDTVIPVAEGGGRTGVHSGDRVHPGALAIVMVVEET